MSHQTHPASPIAWRVVEPSQGGCGSQYPRVEAIAPGRLTPRCAAGPPESGAGSSTVRSVIGFPSHDRVVDDIVAAHYRSNSSTAPASTTALPSSCRASSQRPELLYVTDTAFRTRCFRRCRPRARTGPLPPRPGCREPRLHPRRLIRPRPRQPARSRSRETSLSPGPNSVSTVCARIPFREVSRFPAGASDQRV
jgi:hypothetical protein